MGRGRGNDEDTSDLEAPPAADVVRLTGSEGLGDGKADDIDIEGETVADFLLLYRCRPPNYGQVKTLKY